MPDVDLSAELSRDLLSLAPLQINDHGSYYAAPQFLGGQLQYNRTQAGGPWLHGMRTVNRIKQNVTEQCTIEVKADSSADAQEAMATLITALQQDTYTLTVILDGQATYQYLCEAADYQVVWAAPRLVAKQGQLTFSVERQPVPLVGVF